jgi:predicted O-methyltransferase YrrM
MPKQWTPDDVLSISRSYQSACALAAAADWDVFTVLGKSPMSAQTLASALKADVRATTTLLDALVVMELLSKDNAQYSVAPDVREILAADGNRSVLAMAQHQANCLRRWAQLSRVLQTGRPPERLPSVRGAAADQQAFIGAMSVIHGPVAAGLIAEIRPPAFRRLLDVGGASGTWTIAFLQAFPDTVATIFDLPDVIPMARRRIADAGLADRVSLVSGDFYVDDLPPGADLAWLSAIAHQNSRDQNRALFAKTRRALTNDGTLLLRDVVMDESHTRPPEGAMFAINMLVATQGGGTYSFHEYREDLEAAGFRQIELIRSDEWMNAVIAAKK